MLPQYFQFHFRLLLFEMIFFYSLKLQLEQYLLISYIGKVRSENTVYIRERSKVSKLDEIASASRYGLPH